MVNGKYKEILKATSLFGSVQGLNILLNLVRTKFVAVLLGPEGVGLNSIYNETRELVHSTTNLGLDVSGVRGISAAYEERLNASDANTIALLDARIGEETTVLRSWVLLLALLGMLLCMLCAAPLSYFTFDDSSHTWGYVLLSPAVAFSTITCGELAVLKGLRRLKALATVSVLNVLAGLFVSIPFYYVWGIEGVLPALLTLGFTTMVITLVSSCRAQKYRLVFSNKELRKGNKMLSVGFNFVMCSIIGHLALLGIQAYLNRSASLEMVGLYNSAYTLTMTYAGLVFAAMETDYFPRLSGVIDDLRERTDTLLKQVDVTLILVTPLLAAMIVALPLMVTLLLSNKFVDIIPMAQMTTVGLLFRAIYLPNAYMSLAAGNNKTFLFINTFGAIDILLVIVGYHYAGLNGMGIALTVQNFMDMLLVMAISYGKYGVRFSSSRLLSMLAYTLLLFATYVVCSLLEGWQYWVAGTVLTLLTAAYSVYKYRNAR